ncbi:prealbumin-like fold domain-containing protein [Pseudoramibacter alactolyticus]|uniref:prealbumin-like fold domain-containing protein n=2 Tax=Pseudoramibacter alactolyticus TaxID=113287 RepID=UPI002354CB45|nr:prealbumin-like fold domain-containing protein [Pseudoramibacter alactolyticus]
MNGKENLMTIKRHALMMIAALAFMMIFLIPATMTSVHAEGEITHEKVGEWGGQEATVFKYNGMKCFCVESKNSGPSEALGQEISEKPDVFKALYYGQYGQKPWSGFEGNEAKGVVVTSRVLSDFYTKGTDNETNNDHIEGVKEFKDFLKTQPAPPTKATQFAKSELKVSWNSAKKVQVTEENEVKGDAGQTLSFVLPEGVRLIKKDGTVLTKNITLSVGDSFHLEADAGVTGEYSTGSVGKNFVCQPLIVKTAKGKQDLGHLNVIKDTAAATSFKAQWLKFSNVSVTKKDITNKKELPGAKMKVLDAKTGDLVDEWTSTQNAHFIKNLVTGREYILKEVVAPKDYELNHESIKFVAGQDQTVTMYDKHVAKPVKSATKPGKSVKTGDNTSLLLPVAIFLTGAAVLIVLGVIANKRKMNKRG